MNPPEGYLTGYLCTITGVHVRFSASKPLEMGLSGGYMHVHAIKVGRMYKPIYASGQKLRGVFSG